MKCFVVAFLMLNLAQLDKGGSIVLMRNPGAVPGTWQQSAHLTSLPLLQLSTASHLPKDVCSAIRTIINHPVSHALGFFCKFTPTSFKLLPSVVRPNHPLPISQALCLPRLTNIAEGVYGDP